MSLDRTGISKLEVIGAGFGRTGTESLQAALNQLGYKCDHMKDLVHGNRKLDIDLYYQCFKGDITVKAFAEEVFEKKGITAVVDFPASIIWKELAEVYPDAKIIYTQRDSFDKWWDSATATIFKASFALDIAFFILPILRSAKRMLGYGFYRIFDLESPRLVQPAKDKEVIQKAYEANAKAAASFNTDRMLIYDVRQGWDPLCKFLGKEVPDSPFPRLNARTGAGWSTQNEKYRTFLTYVVLPSLLIILPGLWLRSSWRSVDKSRS